MFSRRQLQMVSKVIVCLFIVFGSLIFQGCGENAPPGVEETKTPKTINADTLAAREKYYADLDAKYPNGRPPMADYKERAKDEAYLDELQQLGIERVRAAKALEAAEKALSDYRTLLVKTWTEEYTSKGAKLNDRIIELRLDSHAHYQTLLKNVETERQNVDALRKRVSGRIHQQTVAPQREYDQMLLSVETQVKEAGLPPRGVSQTQDSTSAPEAVKQ